jgi:nicotinamidase-related amidase
VNDNLMTIDPATTALVLVDLQGFTVNAPTMPLHGKEVLANAVQLAEACRQRGILVVLVKASAGLDGATLLHPPADKVMHTLDLPPGSHDIPADLGPKPEDVVVTKYQWGGFFGTDLDVQLRRRGITNLVMGGIATNLGVESTVRQAFELGYSQIFVSDAAAAFTEAEHRAPIETVFPRIARVRTTQEVLAAL